MNTAPTASPPDLASRCSQTLTAFEQLLLTQPTPDQLLGETLRAAGITLRAAGAALFMTDSPDQPQLAIEHNFSQLRIIENHAPLPGTLIAVRRAARELKPLIVPPFYIDSESGDLPVNPSACELLFVPMKMHGKAALVMVIAVAPTHDPQLHRTQLNFLQRLLALLEATLTQRQLSLIEQDRTTSNRLTQFAENVHRHLLLPQVAADIANLTRDVLTAQRVTVELYPKAKKSLLAVSNVDEPNRRAALFQAQRLILDHVRDRAISVTLTRAAATQLLTDPALQNAATAYFLASEFDTFLAAPILANEQILGIILAEYTDTPPAQTGAMPCGAGAPLGMSGGMPDATGLRSSQTRAEQPTKQLPLLTELARLCASAIQNAITHHSIPLRRPLSALASIYRKPFTTRRAAIASLACVIAIVITLLALVPVDFAIKADCNVQPVSQLAIVAPLPGQIIAVPVRAGDHVFPRSAHGKPLFIFDTTDFRAQRAAEQQKDAELSVDLKNLQEKGDISKIGGIQLQLKQIADQIALLDHRIDQSTVYSPIEGTILTENIEQKKWATVQPGEPLVDVASFKDWVLLVDVPETEVATVRDALSKNAGIQVDYILYPWPDHRYAIHASSVAALLPAGNPSKNANVFRLQIPVNPRDLPDGIALSGVTGRAKLHVGTKPLLSQWTRTLSRLAKMMMF